MYNEELYHHGILGQKWGVRKYQNPDGTLTDRGKKHYARWDAKWDKKQAKLDRRKSKKTSEQAEAMQKKFDEQKAWKKARRDYKDDESYVNKALKTILLGPAGAYVYNSMKTSGYSRASAFLEAYKNTVLNIPVVGDVNKASQVADEWKIRNR